MRPIRLPPQSPEQIEALEKLYHTTKAVRLRTRVQMMLLAAEKQLVAREIAEIVREDEQTVRRWMKRYMAEGIEGLKDAPRPGSPAKVTTEYKAELIRVVRLRPRSMGLEFSLWTLQRLADYMAEKTGIRVTSETVRQHLAKHDLVLSRPQHKISSPDPEYEVKKRRLKMHETI
jgi:transposase